MRRNASRSRVAGHALNMLMLSIGCKERCPWTTDRQSRAWRSAISSFFPAGVLCLRSIFECVALGVDRRSSLLMLPSGSVQGGLCLPNRVLAAHALYIPGGHFPPACALAPPLFLLERKCCLALSFVVGRVQRM